MLVVVLPVLKSEVRIELRTLLSELLPLKRKPSRFVGRVLVRDARLQTHALLTLHELAAKLLLTLAVVGDGAR